LKDCGVFGVSSDEYLNYAMKNREEWEIRGHEVVMEMVEAAESGGRRQKVVSPPVSPVKNTNHSRIEC
jgi:hypothetical protein